MLVLVAGGIFLFSNGNGSEESGITAQTPAPTEEIRVVIQNHTIPQEPITVPVGTTVVFENKDSFEGLPYDKHTITTGLVDPSGKSGVQGVVPNSGSGNPDGLINAPLDTDGTFSFRFTEPGDFLFYLAEHPNVSGQGVITINAVEETFVGEEVIKMEARSFSFSPDSVQAQVGEQVSIDVTSAGKHTFTIDELGVDVALPNDETTRVVFTPKETGTFEFYCSIPGHREAGQVGMLVVE